MTVSLKKLLINVYLDWVNNFLTVSAFADHYELDEISAKQVIKLGNKLHEREVKRLKGVINDTN